jgi:DNA-binding Xre family transcriptional regulator
MKKLTDDNKIKDLMYIKGYSLSSLSKSTGIPSTTLSRLISYKVKKPKIEYMEKISKALNVSVNEIFDVPEIKNETLFLAIMPEEAGKSTQKVLNEEESLLLYFFQTSSENGRMKILKLARQESEITNKKLLNLVDPINKNKNPKKEDKYNQLSLDFTNNN